MLSNANKNAFLCAYSCLHSPKRMQPHPLKHAHPIPRHFLGAQARRERAALGMQCALHPAEALRSRRFPAQRNPSRPPARSCTGRGRRRAGFSCELRVSSGAAGRLSGWKGALKLVMRPLSATCCPHTSRSTTTPVQAAAPPSTSHHPQQQR